MFQRKSAFLNRHHICLQADLDHSNVNHADAHMLKRKRGIYIPLSMDLELGCCCCYWAVYAAGVV